MMRFFLLCCLGIVAGSWLVYQILQGSGYVLIALGDTRIEMSLWFSLAALIIVVVLIWLIVTLLRGGIKGMLNVKQKIVGYSEAKAQQQTISGLIDFIEGDWLNAHKKLTRSAKQVASPIINHLAAARSAYELGREQEALQILHQAEKSASNSQLAVALTQARMQMANQQFEQALATLNRASKINANHSVVLNLLQKVYIELNDWQSLKELLPKLHQQKIGSVKERYLLEQRLFREILSCATNNNKGLGKKEQVELLHKTWKMIPAHFQQDKEIVLTYTNALLQFEYHDDAEKVLSQSLRKEWCDDWVYLYGLVQSSDVQAALLKAETWLKTQSQNPVLLATLGRLCLQNQQWGRAKDFLSASVKITPVAEVYAELARLHQFLNEPQASYEANQKGLFLLSNNLLKIDDFNKSA